MSDERLTDVELKLMDHEQTIETLNQVVLEQAARIDALEERLAQALERQAGGEVPMAPFDPEAERPPHY